MRTTLVPPTYYEVKQPDSPTRLLDTITDLSAVLVRPRPGRKVVLATTGTRQRRLTGVELRELGRALGTLRPLSVPPEPRHAPRAPA